MLLEISWKVKFNGIYFIRFGLRMGEILNFKYFCHSKFKQITKITFWKEESIENMVTFEGLRFNSRMKNWDVPLVLLERFQWTRFNGVYFVNFGLRMWEISKFKWFVSLKIQINYKKPSFGKKNQWRMQSLFNFGYEV